MKKVIFSIIFFLSIYSTTLSQSTIYHYEVMNPSIFLLFKNGNYTNYDWYHIIKKALSDSDQNILLDNLNIWENIILIEEDNYWVVSFHMRGNGMVPKRDKNYKGLQEWKDSIQDAKGVIVYLDKESLNKIDPPLNALKYAPSPFNTESLKNDLLKQKTHN